MKVLKIHAEGLPLLKDGLDVVFYAQQRVTEENTENLYKLFNNIYLNCANGIIGINASGKTTVLRSIDFALNLLNNEPLNHIATRDILGESNEAVFDIIYQSNTGEICRLVTTICSGRYYKNGEVQYRISAEKLFRKPYSSVKYKKQIANFEDCTDVIERNQNEDFLSDDVSFVIAQNKRNRDRMQLISLLDLTDVNLLEFTEDVPAEIVQFLDPSIESLNVDQGGENEQILLKFKGQPVIRLQNSEELNRYLSSGTIKGIRTFNDAIVVLKQGGYVIVDEIEDHFNKEIVVTLLRFFMDNKLNKKGGTVIFSTHYPELLDEFGRNDSIFITRNRDGITLENLSEILKRNDIKKSEAYQSGFLEGTVPMYQSYMTLKKKIWNSVETEG
jgi:AAA15 family ATPase/GTPase